MKQGHPGDAILNRARELSAPMISFLREIVAIASPTGGEEAVVRRVAAEMEAAGFAEVKIDPLGNLLGRVDGGDNGSKRPIIAFDAHLDTVAVGDPAQWHCDPLAGKLEDGKVYGRGSVDQKAGMAAMVYAGQMMREFDLLQDCEVWMVGSVMEEDCDGLCWHHILQEGTLRPDLVISTEPTGLEISRGQRGRMEIRVRTRGVSCHGSMPHLGQNAVYALARAIGAVEKLNGRLAGDDFLGPGTCTVTWVGSEAPSLCAVPDRAELHIDRRLTGCETRASALAEIEAALSAAQVDGEVFTLSYAEPSWTGLVYPMEKYYPTWTLPPEHPALAAACAAYAATLGREATVGRWNFSTNGVAIAGLHQVPCLGLGPGDEGLPHPPNEDVPVDEVLQASAVYAALPAFVARM